MAERPRKRCLLCAALIFCLILEATIADDGNLTAGSAVTLANELSILPEEGCMSISQLEEILPLAALNLTNHPYPTRSTVILTSCDLAVRKIAE